MNPTQLKTRWAAIVTATLLAGAAFTPTPAAAQGAVKGVVTDSSTKKAIVGVTVTIVGSDLKSITAADGSYRLAPVSNGDKTVRAEMTGYLAVEHRVAVADTGSVTVSFDLVPVKTGATGSGAAAPRSSKGTRR